MVAIEHTTAHHSTTFNCLTNIPSTQQKNIFAASTMNYHMLQAISADLGERVYWNRVSSVVITKYSKEELVAEMGACFLCGHAGIENSIIENSAAYIAGWLKALKNDQTLLIHAAGAAQRASDYILNVQPHEQEE